MTAGDILFAVEAMWEQADVNITLDRPTALIALNECAQQLYPVELMCDESSWTSSQAFSGTTVAYPANYRDTRVVEVPAAAIGAARHVGYREWQTVLNNAAITSTADDPIYRQDASGIVVSPSSTGVHYYLRTIPEITSYSQDLFAFPTPACLWSFQEALILGTLHLLTLRDPKPEDLSTSELAKVFELSERWKQEYELARKPIAIYGQNTQMPKFGKPEKEVQNAS